MTAKQYMNQYQLIRAERRNLIALRNNLVAEEAQPGGMDYSADRVQASPSDQMADLIVRIQKKAKNIDSRIAYIDKQMTFMEQEVNKLDDAKAKVLLSMRYIEGFDWVQISLELSELFPKSDEEDYSVDYVKGELHSKSLDKMKTLHNLTHSYGKIV